MEGHVPAKKYTLVLRNEDVEYVQEALADAVQIDHGLMMFFIGEDERTMDIVGGINLSMVMGWTVQDFDPDELNEVHDSQPKVYDSSWGWTPESFLYPENPFIRREEESDESPKIEDPFRGGKLREVK